MSYFTMCCVLSVFLAIVSSTNVTEYQKHFRRVHQFSCKEPQRRAIAVSTLLNLESDQVFHPAVTVLHRCDAASGCCPQNERLICGPEKIEQVSLVFSVKKVISEKLLVKQRRRDASVNYVTVVATNHTLCGCQDIADLPK